MTRNQRPRSRIGFLLLFILLGAIVCVAAVYAYSIPIAAEKLGSSSTNLDLLDRLYLATYLLTNEQKLQEHAGDPSLSINFEILEGESAVEVVGRLEAVSLVHDGELLLNYLEYRGMDVGVKAGTHELSGSMTVVELAEKLQSAISSAVPFTVVAGWRIEQIAETLPTSGLNIDPETFLDAAHARPVGYSFAGEIPTPPILEGFLLPDTYTIDRETTVVDLVVILLDNFEAKVDADLHEGFEQQGLSLYQGVTLASIIEREAMVADEMPIIASVFLNRLALDMKLDADATIQYALGRQMDDSWWKSPLALVDLSYDSPYNTYLYPGLPPTPICNPGLEALQAVAHPAETEYLYFRALCDDSGRHAFAETFEQHQQNSCP